MEDVLFVAFHPETENKTGMFFVNREADSKVPKVAWTLMERLWNESCELVKIENTFSLLPTNTTNTNELEGNPQTKDVADEVIDFDELIISEQLRGNLHTSVTLLNNEGGNSNNNREALKSAAVTPLDGNKHGSLGILASTIPIGIFTSSVATGMFDQ